MIDQESREYVSRRIADDLLEELERRIPEIQQLDPMVKKVVRETLRYRAEKCIEKLSLVRERWETSDDEDLVELL